MARTRATAGRDPVPTRRKRLKAPERRATIVAAARDVFLDQGFSGARTRAIAERAEVTEAVLYRHFASKEEIFEAAVLQPLSAGFDRLLERSREALGVERPREERIAALQTVWLEDLEALVLLLGVGLFSSQDIGRDCYQNRILPFLEAMLQETAQAGLLPSDHQAPEGWAVIRAAFGMHVLLAWDRLQTGEGPDSAELVGEITDLFFLGLSGGQSLRLGH